MSYPELSRLTRAEQLFDAGKLDKALKILSQLGQFEELNSQRKRYFQFLKGMILIFRHESEQVIKFGEEILKESQKHNDHFQSFDGLFFIIIGKIEAEKSDEAYRLIEKAETSFKLISNVSKKILIQREARLNLLKAHTNMNIGNIDFAEKCLKRILVVKKELGKSFEIVYANTLMGQIMFLAKWNINLAMKYFKKAMLLAQEIKFNHHWLAMCHGFLAMIYNSIGELDNSLEHFIKASELVKGFKSNFWDAALLNNIGMVYCEKGNYDLALEYLKKSLSIFEILSRGIEGCLDSLIYVALEKGDIELAQKYFHQMETMYNQTKDSHVELHYQYNRALMLKTSSRIRDKAFAEELLKQIINTETLHYDLINNAYIHLCDLFLAEFSINNNIDVLDELNYYIAKLLTIAEKSHSYLVFCETFILQAKIALIKYEIKAARRFLTQAQKIAEKYGITRLEMKISHEHDKLLRQIKMWGRLKESDASYSERWQLAGLNEQMENMIKKRKIEAPRVSEEEPVSIFIITEGGSPLFSHAFIDQKSFESQIFASFLTTIDYFIREMFSEGLDRATFGEYTLLLKSIPPFFISYIFKGDSYYAYKKINYFMEHIQKEENIWQNLLKSFQANQAIHLKDIPLLQSLITELFILKSIASSEL